MRWFYSDGYDYGTGLPGEPREIHGFVLRKPSEIRDRLIASAVVAKDAFEAPEAVSEDDLRRVHSGALIESLHASSEIARAIELPEAALLPAFVLRRAVVLPQLVAAGGTCAALRAAAAGEWAANLSGGFHHARRDLAHGFCLVADVAIAVARLREEGRMRQTAIVDLDLHQGDGNASLFAGVDDVFTLSIHEQDLFPIPKMRSDLDVGLPAGTADAEYIRAIDGALVEVAERFEPEILVYVAGSDPYENDPLGSLRVSREALLERDRRVASFAASHGCGLVALPAGGYTDESPAITAAGFRAIAELAPARSP